MGRRDQPGAARLRVALLLPRSEDSLVAHNAALAIDGYFEMLALVGLGLFNAAGALAADQPAFDPALPPNQVTTEDNHPRLGCISAVLRQAQRLVAQLGTHTLNQ